MQLYPAIDMKNGQCVRLRQGAFKDITIYSDAPEKVAAHWQEKGASFLHLVDLDGALAGYSVNEEVIRRIADTVSIPIEIGGGIRSKEAVERMLDQMVRELGGGPGQPVSQPFFQDCLYAPGGERPGT